MRTVARTVPCGMPSRCSDEGEDVVPEPGLEVALRLRQVEVRAAAAVEQLLRVVEEVQAEVDQRADDGGAVDHEVLLVEVPAAGAHHDGGETPVGAQRVLLALRVREGDGPADRVAEVDLAADHVVPVGSTRVLHVGQPDPGAGVEGVDRHLAVGRAGHLDAAVDEVRRRRGHRQSPSRTSWVSARKSSLPVRETSSRRVLRAARSSSRRAPNSRCRAARKSRASGVRMSLLSVDGRAGDLDWGLRGHWSLLPWCRAAGTWERCRRGGARPRRPPGWRCPAGSRRRGPRGRRPGPRPGRRPTARCSCC